MEGTHESARLNRTLGNTAIGKLGMLRMPNGEWTESLEEVIQNILQVHFPGYHAVVVSEDTSPMGSTLLLDFQKISTYQPDFFPLEGSGEIGWQALAKRIVSGSSTTSTTTHLSGR